MNFDDAIAKGKYTMVAAWGLVFAPIHSKTIFHFLKNDLLWQN